jgi:hypothetical protein
MGLESSAINEMVHLSTSAQAMWHTESAPPAKPAARHLATPRRRPLTEVRDITIRAVRSIDWRRPSTLHRIGVAAVAMLALLVGLALSGDASPVVGNAAAASAARVSTLTVTPIEAPTTITVTPIEVAPVVMPAERRAGAEIEMPADAVAKKAKPAKKKKKARKRVRGMSSADEQW